MPTKNISIHDPKINAVLKLKGHPINACRKLPSDKLVKKYLKDCEEYVRAVVGIKKPTWVLFLINSNDTDRGYFTRMYRGVPRFSLNTKRVYKSHRAAECRQEMLASEFAKVTKIISL